MRAGWLLGIALALTTISPLPAGAAPGATPALPRHAAVEMRSLSLPPGLSGPRSAPFADALRMVAEGRFSFRFDTFGDEAFWGDTLRLHEALAKTTPRDALALGLKVDVDALPRQLAADLKAGRLDLDDPANTV